MPWTSEHTKLLVDTGERLKTADGKEVEIWEFRMRTRRQYFRPGRSTSEITIAWIPRAISCGANARDQII